MFSVGVGSSLNLDDVQKLSSHEQIHNVNYFLEPRFEILGYKPSAVLFQVCESASPPLDVPVDRPFEDGNILN